MWFYLRPFLQFPESPHRRGTPPPPSQPFASHRVHENPPKPAAVPTILERALSIVGRPPFYILTLILFAVFLITHLPFFWYFPGVTSRRIRAATWTS